MPTTSEPNPSPPSPPPSLPNASTSYVLPQEPSVKQCSICSLPLLPSSSGSEPDPFLLRLGDDPSLSDGSSVPMMCGRCSRERRIGIRGQGEEGSEEEEEEAVGRGNRVDSLDGFGGEGGGGRTSIDQEQHGMQMEGAKEESEEDEQGGEGGRDGRTAGHELPPPSSSLNLPSGLPTTTQQPSLDSVVETAFSSLPILSPRATTSQPLPPPSQSPVALTVPPPASTTTTPNPPPSFHPQQPPTPSTSTYVLPPHRDPVLDLTRRRVPSIGKVSSVFPPSYPLLPLELISRKLTFAFSFVDRTASTQAQPSSELRRVVETATMSRLRSS